MFTNSATANHGFIISDSFKTAWNVFKKDWIVIYGVQLLPIAVAVLYNLLVGEPDGGSAIVVVLSIVYFIAQLVVSMGVIKALIELVRGKKVDLNTITSVAPRAVNFIISQILMMLIVLGGLLLFIVPGIIFAIKFMFTPYLVVDKNLGPIEALKASAKMTDGIKWDLIGFSFATMVLMYSGILALFVGLIVTLPLGTLAYVVLYEKLSKRL